MESLFYYLSNLNPILVALLLIIASLLIGVTFTFVISRKLHSTKSFFITSALMPIIVAAVISMVGIFLNDATSGVVRIATIAVALGLIRFRSMNSKGEELIVLFTDVAIGLIIGLGYLVFAIIFTVMVAVAFIMLSRFNIFANKKFSGEQLLKVTIPESVEYKKAFKDVFSKYLKNNELLEAKTVAMGTLVMLTFKIEMKNQDDEQSFMDELRTKNSNLEIAILPYSREDKSL